MNIGKCSVCGRERVLGIDDRCRECIEPTAEQRKERLKNEG